MTYLTDDARWSAVQRRDRTADGAFVFAVKTTGVYCRPTCPGRPLRANASFFDAPEAARAAGFRACKRCRPEEARETLRFAVAPCELGQVLVCVSDAGLRAVLLGDDPAVLRRDLEARFSTALIRETALEAELAAVRCAITAPGGRFGLPLDVRGGNLAQAVWAALRAIPLGQTRSYAEIAQAIGRPRAARVVAQACAANPLAVVVPCHRVVRADGGLSGYRWGPERKRALIAREAVA
jgi:AraC family transcriptional regulator of adaptative response/methylated-DNA-[protein]-cysteine methyltransferase